jgi:pyruvate/2-oxoglutarate dehydrogenase complex dihydrolipoamide dehydrogenase (E3) component
MKDEIMEDMHYVHKVGISERLDKNKAEIITGAKVRKFSGNTVLIEKDGKETELTGFDNIILAMGVVPYNPLEKQLKGMVPELYTIGDASKARDALAATEEASSLAVGI